MKYYFFLIALCISISSTAQEELSEMFKSYQVFDTETAITNFQSYQSKGNELYIDILDWHISLEPSNILTEDYKHVDHTGKILNNDDRAIAYRGTTAKGGKVALTIGKNFIYGLIQDGDKTYYIEPLSYYSGIQESDKSIIYKSSDVKFDSPRTCAVDETYNKLEVLDNMNGAQIQNTCYDIEYGVCSDYSMVSKYGSTNAVESHNIGLVNNVNSVYDDEFDVELRFVISGQYTSACNTCDPWTSSLDASALLSDFASWGQTDLSVPPISIDHNVATLFSNRDFAGSTVGLAYVGTVCNTNAKYNVIQDHTSNAELMRTTTAHELGHNLNAQHDTGSGYIMSSFVNNTIDWSINSINTINNFVSSIPCLSICEGSPAIVEFADENSELQEVSDINIDGCEDSYKDYELFITITSNLIGNASVQLSTNSNSSAVEGEDFILLTTNVTFAENGPQELPFSIRIYDDIIEETQEFILLDLTITGGDAELGPIDQHTIQLVSTNDEISDICCFEDDDLSYGLAQFVVNGVFLGGISDARTRTLMTASQLSSMGLSEGYIHNMSLNVYTKNSTSAFNDFRIGLLNVPELTLSGMPWQTTNTVFEHDVNTVAGWNQFTFDQYFYWDGISSIYFEFCFNNDVAIGNDGIVAFGTTQSNSIEFLTSNIQDGCSLSGGYSYYTDLQLNMKLGPVSGAKASTTLDAMSEGNVKAGQIAHFYDDSNKILASIENLGAQDLFCVQVTNVTSGISQEELPFGAGDFSERTLYIDVEQEASYELTLYYDDTELGVWGTETLDLNVFSSSVPLSGATELNSNIQSSSLIIENAGDGNMNSYQSTQFGSVYVALTDAITTSIYQNISDASLIIEEPGKGIVFSNQMNEAFEMIVGNDDNIHLSALENSSVSVELQHSDLNINNIQHNFILTSLDGAHYTVSIDEDGMLQTAEISTFPDDKVIVESGSLLLSKISSGIILMDEGGSCRKVFVDVSGALATTLVSCTN